MNPKTSLKIMFSTCLLCKTSVASSTAAAALPCLWCPPPESNRHFRRNGILNPARLPIPPEGPFGTGATIVRDCLRSIEFCNHDTTICFVLYSCLRTRQVTPIVCRRGVMIRALYDWVFNLARHRRASWALSGISFAESSFFPIPPDILLIPMVLPFVPSPRFSEPFSVISSAHFCMR